MKTEFSGQMFEMHSTMKIHENLSCSSRVIPWGETDGCDEGNAVFTGVICAPAYFAHRNF
jgi:hypothetical protein